MGWKEQLSEEERDELIEAGGEAVEFLDRLCRAIRQSPDARSEEPQLLPDLEGKGGGWLGGPFFADQLRDLVADLEMTGVEDEEEES